MRKLSALLMAIVAVCCSANMALAQSADEIIDNYIEAIGGEKNWKNVQSMKMEGKMSGAMLPMEIPFTMMKAKPEKTRMVLDIMGQTMITASDGETSWMQAAMMGKPEPTKLTKEEAEQQSMGSSDEIEPEFLNYAEKGHSIELMGEVEVEGTDTYKIKLITKKGDESYHYFDAEYFVPVKIESVVNDAEGNGSTMATLFSDYEEVDGLMMAFTMEIEGPQPMVMTFTKVEFNKELDDSLFAFPGE